VRILAALGDKTVIVDLRAVLENAGMEVTCVPDALAAWQELSRDNEGYDVLIAEGTGEAAEGIALASRIRARTVLQDGQHYLYVMLLTPAGSRDDRMRVLSAGADDYLTAPVEETELLGRLEVAKRVLSLQVDARNRAKRTERQGELRHNVQRLGEILVEQGVIAPDRLQRALDIQVRTGQMLGPLLLAYGWAGEEDITRARALQMDVPYVNLAEVTPEPVLMDQVPFDLAQKHRMLPLSVGISDGPLGGEVVRVAIVNPWNIEGLDAVQRLVGCRPEPYLVSENGLEAALKRSYKTVEDRRKDAMLLESFEMTSTEAEASNEKLSGLDEDLDASLAAAKQEISDEAPIIRLVNSVLADAVRRRASDIHIEPYKTDFEIRYRIDGELQVIRTLPRQALSAITSRLKVMSDLDISERRVPQDGRIALKMDNRGVDLRVSTLPTQFGERIVMRVLDRAAARLSLDKLDFSPRNRQIFDGLIHRPHGIILVTGPTGSGKTTTLYSALNALKSPTTNIMTCEDPIEYELDRISQSAVNVRAGLTFAAQLRAILRQDPDVVLVGEIRDTETAETAFRAALTGHLVLSTLHCNEAAGAPTRLLDMGVPPFLISSALIGVVAQRLLRRLCPSCRVPVAPSSEQRLMMEMMGGRPGVSDTLYRPVGCPECDNRGMRGRIGAHEVLAINDQMQSHILREGDTAGLRELALRAGMVPMVRDGLEKAYSGHTTIEEVQRRLFAEANTERPVTANPEGLTMVA
jgi:type IV pilus assembly protein PilB